LSEYELTKNANRFFGKKLFNSPKNPWTKRLKNLYDTFTSGDLIIYKFVYRKNIFVESKNLTRYRSENNFVRPSKYCYVKRLNVDEEAVKSFNILPI